MSNPDELALVVKAIKSGLGGCVEWDDTVIDRLTNDLARYRLKLHDVRTKLIQHVRNGGEVFQKEEDRETWKDRRDYWYYVIVPTPVFPKGLFVELELRNSDPDYPEVNLVNAHEEF
jgi:hypothetical protein